MKTLVVFSALVVLITAAPAPHEKDLPIATKEMVSKTPEFIKREKKSPQQQDTLIPSLPEETSSGFETLPSNFNPDVEGPMARSHFSFKGPIVVKKKTGYHVYRDSEEERAAADSHETCGKQMRVKLCNAHMTGKSDDLALNEQNLDVPNNDVESSILVAKEAIESLQKNLQKLEQNGQWKHGQSEMDTNMHHNIETVQNALHTMQGRIGKLESMNLRATTLKDAKVLKDMTKGKSEEERYAQWKEAMENIQKNVEVVKNIEDSFKSADESLLPETIDTTKFMRSESEDLSNHKIPVVDEKDKKIEEDHHKALEKSTSETNDHEMTAAASEPFETTANVNTHMTGKSSEMSSESQSLELENTANVEKQKGRSADSSLPLHKDDQAHEEDKTKLEQETAFRVSENKKHDSNPAHNEPMKNIDSQGHETTKTVKTVWENERSSHLGQVKNAWEETHQDTTMKMADPTNLAKDASAQPKGEFERLSIEDSEKMASEIKSDALKHDKSEFQMKHSDLNPMTIGQGMPMTGHKTHMPGHEMMMQGHGMHMMDKHMNKGKFDMHKPGNKMHMLGHSEHMQGQDMYMPVHDMHMQGHKMHMKGPEMHMPGHGMPMAGHDMHMPGHEMHMLKTPGFAMKHGKHGKSSDLDTVMQPSLQMNMREVAGKSAMDNFFQWKHHDSARSAYGGGYGASGLNLAGAGAGAGAGSEALGIFPNAKVGGCGIPLLLSCSPSVVQGSLAKSHSSYAAPAYRTEDDFGLKKKRDVIKTKDLKTVEKSKVTTNLNNKKTEILESLI